MEEIFKISITKTRPVFEEMHKAAEQLGLTDVFHIDLINKDTKQSLKENVALHEEF